MNSSLEIKLDGDNNGFRPGEKIEGRANWRLSDAPESITVVCYGLQVVRVAKTPKWLNRLKVEGRVRAGNSLFPLRSQTHHIRSLVPLLR